MPAYHSAGAVSSRARAASLAILLSSGALAFWDPDWLDGLALRQSGEDFYVTAMMDRINGHVVAQATEAAQPLWAGLSPTGRRMLSFNGTSQYLLGGETWASSFGGTAPFTIMSLVRRTDTTGNRVFYGFGHSSTTNQRITLQSNADLRVQSIRNDGTATANNSAVGTLDVARTDMITQRYESGQDWLWLNGDIDGAVNGASQPRTPSVDRFSIGCQYVAGSPSAYAIGLIGPVIVWGSALSDANRETYRNAFLAYYGVAA